MRAEEVTARAIEALGAAGDRPFFLFAHYFDCHNDYAPPPPYDRAFDPDTSVVHYVNYAYYKSHPLPRDAVAHVVAQYDEELRYADAMVGRLLAALEARGRGGDTFVVVTADHGEELFEHGSWGHGHTLHTQVLKVPLIVAGPGVARGRVEDALVRHEDLAPTLLALLGMPRAEGMMGESYAAALTGAAPAAGGPGSKISARSLLADTSRFDSNAVGLVTPSQALLVDIAGRSAELYALDTDPDERVDRLAGSRARTARTHDDAASRGADALFHDLLGQVLAARADRWIVAWSGGASGSARTNGWILPPGAAADAGAGLGAARIEGLASWASSGGSGEARIAVIPPDAAVDFLIDCGTGGRDCGWVGERRAEGSAPPAAATGSGRPDRGAARAAPGAGRVLALRVDPIADGARLRSRPPTPGAGAPAFSIRMESTAAAPSPSELTPEELERLRSLGYVH